tara:strand:- start:129 stop:230 length:102 start_codon:yes stop_codon:yes gene_type:complete
MSEGNTLLDVANFLRGTTHERAKGKETCKKGFD